MLQPCQFVQGSRALLERVVGAIKRAFSTGMPQVVAEWTNFCDFIAPKDDNVDRYVAEIGMQIPLFEELFGDAAVQLIDRATVVSRRNDRERVVFTASVQWSGHGAASEVVNVPYVAAGAATASPNTASASAAAVPRGRRRPRSPSPAPSSAGDADDDCQSIDQFIYVDVSASDGPAVSDYFKYVGRTFDDTDDGGSFKIIGVCEMKKACGRNSTNKVYAFKYSAADCAAATDDHDEMEYTPARELLNCSWCRWVETPAGTGRAARASRRSESTAAEALPQVFEGRSTRILRR